MEPEYELGDVLIKRVKNGWVAVTGNENYSADDLKRNVSCFVYEDTNMQGGNIESLANMLIEQFECYMQSKRQCGINISFNPISKEQEDEINYSQNKILSKEL